MIPRILSEAKNWKIKFYHAALVFLPLLLFYTLIAIIFSKNVLVRDESGFLLYATRILAGKYFSNPNDVQLWWGIGYPLILTPFVFLQVPVIFIKLLNTLFLYGAILFLYHTLKIYVRPIIALVIAFSCGIYLPFLNELQLINNDTFTYLLVSGLAYFSCRLLAREQFSLVNLLLTAFFMAYLALTKVFFGYMIPLCIVLCGIFYIWKRTRELRLMIWVNILALIFCVPYLIGTYAITGNIFYWGTSGGMSLYWMSTPYANEWGDWFKFEEVQAIPELYKNHGADFKIASTLSEPAMDAAFKNWAIDNIVHNPKKFFVNWVANIGRLVFSYPYSYVQPKLNTFYYMVPNAVVATLFLLSLFPALFRWKQIPYEIKLLLFFATLAFLGTSLLSAYVRFFTALMPFLIVWMVTIYFKIIRIKLVDIVILDQQKEAGIKPNQLESIKELS